MLPLASLKEDPSQGVAASGGAEDPPPAPGGSGGLDETDFGGHSISVSGNRFKGRADYASDVLVPEDVGLCESVQRGLHSKGYSQGPMIVDPDRSGRGEHAIHHFHRLVQDALS